MIFKGRLLHHTPYFGRERTFLLNKKFGEMEVQIRLIDIWCREHPLNVLSSPFIYYVYHLIFFKWVGPIGFILPPSPLFIFILHFHDIRVDQ